ncbi:MAG: hypothetical protein QOK04_2207 [Solirubrobacteraceae bacterium]|nr:hypothetical protein [Solirubrobacteraceae bacterium]
MHRYAIPIQARGLLSAVCVIVLAAACQGPQGSSGPTGSGGVITPTTGTASGTSQPVVPGAKPVSMTLLPNWKKVELTDAGLRSAIASVATSNPLLAKTLTDLLESRGYAKFALYAIGYDGDRYIGTVNVAESPATGLDLAGLGQLFEGQIRDLGATDLVSKTVTLPAGPAVQLSYSLIVSSGSAAPATNVDGRLFIFLIDGITYDETFTCAGPDSSLCLAQADQMIQTLHIGS